MKAALSCLSLCALAYTAMGVSVGGGERIVGGIDTDYGDYPEMVSVMTRPLLGLSEHLCGGIIINDNHVLTSASCVQGYGNLDLKVMAAGINLGGTAGFEEYKNVQRIFPYPTTTNLTEFPDIAVLRTAHNFVFVSGLVTPAILPMPDYPEPAMDTPVTVAGWGRDQYEGTLQIQQKAVNLTYVPGVDCQLVYGNNIKDNQGCVIGTAGHGVCEGDEGSGVFAEDRTAVALVAWQVGCEVYPAAVTLLAPYYEWIISMFEA